MAYDIDDIANAIATSLADLQADGVDVQAVSAVPSNPTPSGVYVHEGEIEYDLAMQRGLDNIEMTVTLLVGYGSDLAAQRRLRKLRDGTSGIKALLEVDPTLGGLVSDARVTKASAPRLYGTEATKRPLGCDFTVTVYATP